MGPSASFKNSVATVGVVARHARPTGMLLAAIDRTALARAGSREEIQEPSLSYPANGGRAITVGRIP